MSTLLTPLALHERAVFAMRLRFAFDAASLSAPAPIAATYAAAATMLFSDICRC